MTNDQLIALLQKHPGNMEVVFEKANTEFKLSPVETVTPIEMLWSENTDGTGERATEMVLILDIE